MAIVVVGGSGKDVGKTSLVCGIVTALREFEWTAVKITGHDYESVTQVAEICGTPNGTIREETLAGAKTDTARYLAAGARRALLVTRYGAEVPIEEIRAALGGDSNVIFESNRIVNVLKPDVSVALVSGATANTKSSFSALLRVADALVSLETAGEVADAQVGIPRFQLRSLDRITLEMAKWLRGRLTAPSGK